ncbi:ricin-type beta-trefoil lectin domain protein [Kitasatospora sp. NPDC059160]|uniref:ricin-type beta-trefoil lectin domain protein n=1 Tax=Kitasatospora sp. NPDC059160 TaxID=3346748 RepID=UPI0036764F29
MAADAPVRAGSTPVLLAAPGSARPGASTKNSAAADTPTETPSTVQVKVADRGKAQAAGVDGLLVGLTRADTGKAGAGSVSVSLDYNAIAPAYGGAWASRLRLVAMPACALTTPEVEACRSQTPLEHHNDPAAGLLTGTVTLTASGTPAHAADSAAADRESAAVAPAALAIAAVGGESGGSQGSYAATSLSASGSWSQTAAGAFTYNYPVATPPSLTGSAPSVALSYNSQAIDGETSARNSQASWVGDGWSYSPGFIERSYKTCKDTGIPGSADRCWAGWNATLSLGSHSGELVQDANGVYHLQSDDGTKVERLTGAANGLWQGEYFKVTTTDGTAYYLGLNHAPGTTSDQATNSAWGIPVYHPNSGDPCYSAAGGKSSQCDSPLGYRFSLDFVVDPHGGLQRYDWATETNYYSMGAGQAAAAGGSGKLTPYVRGGYLTKISYGYKLDDAVAGREPSARVTFDTAQRCVVSDSVCQASNLSSATATNWPDVPYDLTCQAGWPTSGTGPNVCRASAATFWSTVRLRGILTELRTTNGWNGVDRYDLKHLFSDAGGTLDPVTGNTVDPKNAGALQSVMWLSEIRHTGLDKSAGESSTAALDPMTFKGIEVDNRVDGSTPAAPPLYRPRISGIQTETGSFIAVAYRDPECSRVKGTMPSSPDSNTMACYPVWWTTPGAAKPIADWFHKTLVAKVTVSDSTKAASPAQTTAYTYSDGAAWHRDDSELTDDQYRTWNDFRGYRTVTTTSGSAPYPVGQATVRYFQGMDGDYKADRTPHSAPKLTNSLGEQVPDSPWLAGMPQETTVYTAAGGAVVSKSLSDVPDLKDTASRPRTAWTSQTDGTPKLSTLPPLAARRTAVAGGRKLDLLSDGKTWRTSRTSTQYDELSRPYQTNNDPDSANPALRTCTTVSYAAPPAANPMMLAYPSENLTLSGPCGTKAGPDTTVRDRRLIYDGSSDQANPGAVGLLGQNGSGNGYVTATQVLKTYDGQGQPVYQTANAQSFDTYGRVTRSVDPTGNVQSTAYTPAGDTLPTEMSTTNPLQWTSKSTIAPARGLVTRAVDANGRITDSTYDALGRRTKVWLPGRNKDDGKAPDRTFAYLVHGSGDTPDPSSVSTQTLRENETYSTSVTIYDGFLQPRQTQTSTANNTDGRLVTSTRYDTHGQPVIGIPTWSDPTTAPGTTLFDEVENSLASEQVTVYDGLSRPVAQQMLAKGALLWQSTRSYPGADRVDTTPPSGTAPTTAFTNALGQLTSSVMHGGSGIGDVTTTYGYDRGGRRQSVTDTAGNTWSYSYDIQGKLVSQTDPDSGTSTTGYDDLGRVTTTTDARSRSVSLTYDAIGRVTGRYDGTSTSDSTKLLASFQYDTLAKGYPTSVTRYVGGAQGSAYVQKVNGYNTAYQATGTTTTIPAAEGKLAGDYTTSKIYSNNVGLLASIGYNAEGGLPSETLGFGYDLQGELIQAGTADTPLLDMANYNARGQLLQSTYGKAGGLLRTAQTYDDATGRLTTNRVSLQGNDTNPVSGTTYGYDQAGNITSVAELQSSGGTDQTFDVQCFRYDGLDRLAEAWTDTSGVSTPTAGQISHCNNPDPAPIAIGGPAPYWQSFQYNLLGDRTQQIKHDVTGDTSRDLVQTSTYQGVGGKPATGPNSLTAVTTTTGPATSTLTSSVGTGGTPNCLDVSGARTANGTAIQSWTCNGNGAQKWTRNADGTLRALGKCAAATGTWPGAPIQLWTCDGSAAQQWQDGANGALVNTASSLCLDLPGANAKPGTAVALWTCNGTGAQQWLATANPPSGPAATATLTPQYDAAGDTTSRSTTTTSTLPSGVPTGATPLCLDASGAHNANGTAVWSWTCNRSTAQDWTIGTDGTLRVLGACARPVGGTAGSGTQIELWACDPNDSSQQWRTGTDGSLVHKTSGLCVDLPGGNTDPGTRVALWTCNRGPNQKWGPGGTQPTAGGTQAFTYNAEGRTESVTTPNGAGTSTSRYLYDAGGKLLIQRGSDGTVLYLFGGAEQLTLSADGANVTGTRYYSQPDGTVVVRSGSGGLTYQPTNPQGTSSLQIDGTTRAVTRRAFDPYGNPRGTAPTSWADNHGYLGKPVDTGSGLNLLGARNYDPAIGRFLTVDPVFEAGDPNQMGGYTYAGDNPTTLSDPTGLWDCGWCSATGHFIAGAVDSGVGWLAKNSPYVAMNNFGVEVDKAISRDVGARVSVTGDLHYIEPSEHPMADIFGIPHNDTAYVAGEVTETVIEVAADGFGLVKAAFKGARLLAEAASESGGIRNALRRLFGDGPKPKGGGGGGSAERPAEPHIHSGGPTDPAAPVTPTAKPTAPAEPMSPARTNCSFTPDTPVLMGDGTTKAIGDIKVGDLVQSADQESATDQGARAVTATLVHTDNDLIDLTVQTEAGTESTVHTTAEHPFWDDTTHTWVPAGHLSEGHALKTVTGRPVRIAAVRSAAGTKQMYNLTVAQLHTYYVVAGVTPILVHNKCDTGSTPNATFHWDAKSQHASITVRSETRTVTTDAFPDYVEPPWGGLESLNLPRIVPPPAEGVFALDFMLPNPEGALAYIDGLFEKQSYMFGEWDKESNSCITYCSDILRAGGLDAFLPGEAGTSLLRGHIPSELYGRREE